MNIYICKFKFDNSVNLVKKEACIISEKELDVSQIRFAIKNNFEKYYDETAYDIEFEKVSKIKDMLILDGSVISM